MPHIPRVLTSAKGATLTAVVAVGLAASVGARAPANDFVSVFDHPKSGFCYVNLVLKKGGNDAAEEVKTARRVGDKLGDFRGIRPIDVAKRQGIPTCSLKQPPEEEK